MSSQNMVNIIKDGNPEDPDVIIFFIEGNTLGIGNGSQIQLSGVDSTLGSGSTRFKEAFNNETIYYVRGFEVATGTDFRFELTTGSAAPPSIGVPGGAFEITNDSVVSFSLAGGICFLGNTSVNTDQGKVKFNELTTKNTINKHQIKKVVSVMNKDDTMVLVKKDSLGDFVPNKDTYISNNHKILIDGNYFEAKNIVNNFNIYTKKMPRKRLYNVLLDHHGTMIVNNMVVETLDPNNKFAH